MYWPATDDGFLEVLKTDALCESGGIAQLDSIPFIQLAEFLRSVLIGQFDSSIPRSKVRVLGVFSPSGARLS
jgi:hypothetical protein